MRGRPYCSRRYTTAPPTTVICTTKAVSPAPAADNIVITLTQGPESKTASITKNTGYLP